MTRTRIDAGEATLSAMRRYERLGRRGRRQFLGTLALLAGSPSLAAQELVPRTPRTTFPPQYNAKVMEPVNVHEIMAIAAKNVSKAVIISGVPPFLLKTADNPEGVDASVFEGIQKAVAADRYAFFTEFFKNFYNTDMNLGKRVSEEAVRASWNTAAIASGFASLACVPTWHEDFRQDVAQIDVPTLVIHGDADRIVPFSSAGQRTAQMIKGAELVVIKGGPHNIAWTHADELNAALTQFLAKPLAKGQASAPKKKAVA